MLKLHVVLAIDRAGLVGEDGETHHGVFDVGFLSQAPGMRILAPGSCKELSSMLTWAVNQYDGPIAIRYPRGSDTGYTDCAWNEELGVDNGVCCHRTGKDATIVVYGTMLKNAMDAAEILHKQGIEVTVLRLLTVCPIPVEQICVHLSQNKRILILEETCNGSGIREKLAWELYNRIPGCAITGIDLGKQFIPHGSVSQLYRQYGLDGEAVAKHLTEVCSDEN